MSNFDRYADTYARDVEASVAFAGQDVDYYARRKADHLIAAVTRHLGDPARMVAVDVGCGIGVTDGHLEGTFAELHGVDTAAEAVAVAAEANPWARYRSYDGTRLPFEDASVDVAFAICVAHHVEPPDRPHFVSEMARVVRPGGLVVIFEHNPLNPLTRVAVSRCEFDEGVILLGRRHLRSLAEGAGLTESEHRYMLFIPTDGALADRADQHLRKLPLGAQHYIVARRP